VEREGGKGEGKECLKKKVSALKNNNASKKMLTDVKI